LVALFTILFKSHLDCADWDFNCNWEYLNITSPPQSDLGRALRLPSRQRMHLSAACASCAMSTADKSNHSAVGTPHPYRTATFFL